MLLLLRPQVEFEKQVTQLSELIDIINGELTKNDRKKLITLCTIDVHARDVVQRLIDERVESVTCFQWQSQLRYYQNEKTKECQVRRSILVIGVVYTNDGHMVGYMRKESIACFQVKPTAIAPL